MKTFSITLAAIALFSSQNIIAGVPSIGFKFFNDSSMSSCLTYSSDLLRSVKLPNISQHPDHVSAMMNDLHIIMACSGEVNTLIIAGSKEKGEELTKCAYDTLVPLIEKRALGTGKPDCH